MLHQYIDAWSDIDFATYFGSSSMAAIAQLGERQTEDLKVPGSIPGGGSDNFFTAPFCM